MSREAMKQALEALELLAKYENPTTKIQVRKPKDGGSIVTMYPHKVATEAAALLRERLSQPEQEREWVGLTDEQVEDEWERITGHSIFGGDRSEGRAMFISPDEVIEFSRAIEAKLKEKNHG